MKGLATSRILVIDDKLTEAAPMLTSLAHNGIAASYYSVQTRGEYPKVPLSGIRLAFLDLELKGNGAPDIKDTAGRFLKCITPENGPYALVTWTKHSEEHTNVITQICEYEPKLRPICSFSIDKYKEDGEPYSFEDLLPIFEDQMKQLEPIEYFTRWEAALHKSAVQTTNNILGNCLEHVEDGDLAEQPSKIIGALAGARLGLAGKTVDSGQEIISAAMSTLLPVMGDVLERTGLQAGPEFEEKILNSCKAYCTKQSQSKPTIAINTALLLANTDPQSVPGSVYEISADEEKLKESIYEDLALLPQDIKKEKARALKRENEELAQTKVRLVEELKTECSYVSVELSNACDFAQQKRRLHRFVGGLLIPSYLDATVKSGSFIKQVGPFFYRDSSYSLILSSRHLFSKDLDEEHGDKLLQLRKQVVTDALAWLSSYIQRPGMLTIPFN